MRFSILLAFFAFMSSHPLQACEYSTNAVIEAYDFISPQSRGPRFDGLLSRYLKATQNLSEAQIPLWIKKNNGQAAAYYALMNAFERTEVILPQGHQQKDLRLSDLVQQVTSIEGDRLRVRLDPVLMMEWILNSATYQQIRPNLTTGAAPMICVNGGSYAGSLHQGYDMQCFTSAWDVPRLQINYRFHDSNADIDLDGFAPWIYNMIPNPFHLTWQNSDIRYWVGEYAERFGDPGFKVRTFLSCQ